jgi:hypothetical protein
LCRFYRLRAVSAPFATIHAPFAAIFARGFE